MENQEEDEKADKKATIFLICSGRSDTGDDWETPTISTLERVHPGITKLMKRGDIIEDISLSGDRSSGIYFFDGEKIIDQNYELDDYGSPPKEFKVISEFPLGYWTIPHNKNVNRTFVMDEIAQSEFYWHQDDPPQAIDLKALGVDNLEASLYPFEDNYYVIITYLDSNGSKKKGAIVISGFYVEEYVKKGEKKKGKKKKGKKKKGKNKKGEDVLASQNEKIMYVCNNDFDGKEPKELEIIGIKFIAREHSFY